jgi:hypothetical protein
MRYDIRNEVRNADTTQIVCRHFIANVLVQVVERHLMRVIDQIIDDDLEVDQMRELVKEEGDVEQKKSSIRTELDMLTKAIAVLEPFS